MEENSVVGVADGTAVEPPQGSTRERILQAAGALFADRGLDDVTVDDVADLAGVSRATVFNHFDNKRGLVEALSAQVLGYYIGLLEDQLGHRSRSFQDQVRALVEAIGRGIEDSQHLHRAIFREIAKTSLGIDEGGPAQTARRTATDRLEQLVTRWQAQRQVINRFDARDLALLFDSVLYGTITRWLYEESERLLRDDLCRMGEMFIGMVEAPPGR